MTYLDVCFDWHPDYENKANMQSSQAIADYTITFKGKCSCSSRSLERSERIRCSYLLLELISWENMLNQVFACIMFIKMEAKF
jgi:hypothetical protein